MSNLLEITGDDIALIKDDDLRTLIGLLCEADYRLAGLSTKGITWGGHQDAADGGLDVVVRSETPPPQSSFIQKCPTAFQVKKPDMNKSKIIKEMRPKGALRAELKNLIRENGSYIIVSSTASTSEEALKNRVDAMKEVVAGEIDHENLHIDFFDRGRIASWLRCHPSLILWVRNKIGRQLTGWYPYDNWANPRGGTEEEYLIDEGLRLHNVTGLKSHGMLVEDGLQLLRATLSSPGISVRLTGLSGVGKTRLIQAMFDERIGKNPLNRYQVYYTDTSNNPIPDPNRFAEWLIASKTRAILVIDNCPPELHRQLTKSCSVLSCMVSLITVEYDVRDDLPEETNVFRLEPASDELIEKLINHRFTYVSQADASKIAKFSGGNSRVAIALANTLRQGDSLSGMRDEELFERLFWQRNAPDKNLLISAEVCSLVYSFEGTNTVSDKSELQFLAALVDQSFQDLYRAVEELRKRQLVQVRNIWRAVLPHAIANRLAARALEYRPKTTIINAFLNSGSERLIKSFTRRLSYLHDCSAAVDIVNDLLEPDGWIGKNNCSLNAFQMAIFKNLAPVAPEKTLASIERAADGDGGNRFTSRDNTNYYEFVKLLRKLAYDPGLFERSVKLMCRYALSELPEENRNSSRDVLKSLFYIYLSGTHASAEARAQVIDELVASDNEDNQELGLVLLDAALETWHFSTSYDFEFGAWSRDYGYEPRTYKDISHWYETFLGICTRLALSGRLIAGKARKLLADRLRGLWTKAGMFEVIENAVKQILEKQAWNEGWIAVRGIINYDNKGFDKEIQDRLFSLENLLKPNSLLERARTYALSDDRRTFHLDDTLDGPQDVSDKTSRVLDITRQIGREVGQNSEVLNKILPELVSSPNYRLGSFGMGLAEGCSNKKELWDLLYDQVKQTPPEKRQMNVLLGFLSSCAGSDIAFYNSVLDALMYDDLLGESFPIFQTTNTIDHRGVQRLTAALDIGKAKIHTFNYLAYGRAHESIPDDDLAILLEKILTKEDGIGVVIEILHMRFYMSKDSPKSISNELMAVARKTLSLITLPIGHIRDSHLDYELAAIAKVCLNGRESIVAAKEICEHFVDAMINYRIHSLDYPNLISSVARTQPFVFLDIIIGNDKIENYPIRRMFGNDLDRSNNPLNEISDDDLLTWCDADPNKRYPLIAAVIQPFSKLDEENGSSWKKIVNTIIEKAPQLDTILENLARSIWPMGWTGSLADILQKRSALFEDLFDHENEEVRSWAKNQYHALQQSIDSEREQDHQRHVRNETFE